jgi:hypothetical protein
MTDTPTVKKKRTWSRELATCLFLCMGYLGYTGMTEELAIVAWPFTIFGMAAFGFKQPSVETFVSQNRSDFG